MFLFSSGQGREPGSRANVASFPGPACSSLAVRNSRRWPGLVHHVMCRSLRHDPSTRINDVIDELAPCLPLKEAPRDHSNGSHANLPKC